MAVILREQGFDVRGGQSGLEGLQIADTFLPDLILLDIQLPGIDGFETLRRVRNQSQLPVILLTARSGDADLTKGFHAGADDYLTKPFNPDELSLRVGAVLRRTAGDTPPALLLRQRGGHAGARRGNPVQDLSVTLLQPELAGPQGLDMPRLLALMFVCLFMAGLFQALLGALRFGNFVKYIPQPVIAGFMIRFHTASALDR